MRCAFEWAASCLLILMVAAGAAAQPAPGETTLKVFINGREAGSERSTVTVTAERIIITGAGALQAPIDLAIKQFEMQYDRAWKPIELTIDGGMRGQPLTLRTTFVGTQAKSEIMQGGHKAAKEDVVSPDTIVLPNSFYIAYEALAARLASATAGADLPVYVAPQSEIRVRVLEVTAQSLQMPKQTLATRKYRLLFANPGGGIDAELWADEHNRLVRLSIPSSALEVVREDAASVAAREETVTRAGDEQVTMPGNGFNLAGTLSRPPAAAPGTRLPALVLVPGSGSVDRDETVAGIPVFAQLAGALADAGFLVIRYDKRGVGQSGGRTEVATLTDYADDLRGIVQFLAKRKDVDQNRIAAVGHNEGAWVALLAAQREKRIAALVLISGAASTGADLILEQQQHLLDKSNVSAADKQAKIDLQKKIQQAVATGTGWEGIPAALRQQADTPWFKSFLAFDPARTLDEVKQPILVVHGALDTQAPIHHADRLAELARARKKSGATELVKIEGINHLLVPAKTGELDEYASLKGEAVSRDVVTAIVTWLGKSLVAKD